MSTTQWIVVLAAGIGGYALVSWIITRVRRDAAPPPQGVPTQATPTDPPPSDAPFRSAWDEFNRKP